MPSEREVYKFHADRYEQLILREDYQNNIPKAIRHIKDYRNLDVIELGAGTGRLTRQLINSAKWVGACDSSWHMLWQAQTILHQQKDGLCTLSTADMRQIPFANGCADMVIAGWSFCYLAVWGGEKWQQETATGLQEAQRVLKPGGVIILLENFGTGFQTPSPPEHLNDYFDFLAEEGFQSNWLRTDFRFASLQEAQSLAEFFFGEDLAQKVKEKRWICLPECTGIFWRHQCKDTI